MFLSYVFMTVPWASGRFWKRLPSWAEWVFLDSTVASESSPLLLEPYGRLMWECLLWVLKFIFAFTNYPFPLFSDLLFHPEKVTLYKNMSFEKQNGARAGLFAIDVNGECCAYTTLLVTSLWISPLLFRGPIQLAACGPVLFHRVILASSHMNVTSS